MTLTPKQVQDLARLLAGTLSKDDLEDIVELSTGDGLFEFWVGEGKPLQRTIQDFLKETELEGITREFLAEVYRKRPNRNDVRIEIALLFPEIVDLASRAPPEFAMQKSGVAEASVSSGSYAPGLQRVIKPHLHHQNIGTWAKNLLRVQRQVCRLEIGGAAAGTGFLVGPDCVLTNWHVVEHAGTVQIVCRFDYQALVTGGRDEGVAVSVSGNAPLAFSPYAKAEVTETPDDPPPTADELDFALLALDRPIGSEFVAGEERGWITLPAEEADLQTGDPLIIVQHPDGMPMKLAIDTEAVLDSPVPERIRYSTNTLNGSSGSPCLTMEWALVALHHLGDPAWGKPVFNQGIPAHLIRQKIKSAGKESHLG
ncbi:serine protease [Labrenzia sp. OB1]|uniref:trypsin-like serine peptidase n=1 Tax=Labrenzia sp. OB1 TaxID=1561204 RepID=UPI000837F926|nr:serine protease [Labrenzia sp. OB1]